MNNARLALQLTGMVFILFGAAVLYYQTDLRENIPEGAFIAFLLVLAGIFVIALSEQVRRARRYAVSDYSHRAPVVQRTYVHDTDRTTDYERPSRRRRVREERVTERIER